MPLHSTTPDSTDHAARLAVDVRRLGWIRPLAGDYVYDFAKVGGLYAGDPASSEAWSSAIARAQRHPRRGGEVASLLGAQQARRGAPAEALAAAAKLADPGTVAIVTGQQAGAFGGPLYTLLKAITALQLARRTARDHQVEAVAVFWVDAEDHDWAEVAGCTVLDASFHPRTVTLAPPHGAGERPIAALTLDDRIGQSLDDLAAALEPTEFTEELLALLRGAYQPAVGVADAFARWLELLLGRHGLVVFESADPGFKPLAAGVFAHELAQTGRTAALATQAGETLQSLGHQPQVVPYPDSIALFRLDGTRRAIKRQGDQLTAGDATFTLEQLATEATTSPDRFSPNVLLRPIVQDTLFPTVCYVAGPSELAYLGQLRGVYDSFGVPMPLIHPRASATLLDSAGTRFVSRYKVPFEELQPQDESALNRLLQSQLPATVDQALSNAGTVVRGAMNQLIEALPAFDPTLAGAARTTLGRMEHDLHALHNKMIQASKRRHDTLRRQFTSTQAQAFPAGTPQERALSLVYFVNQYGQGLIDRLLEELPLDPGRHWVLTL